MRPLFSIFSPPLVFVGIICTCTNYAQAQTIPTIDCKPNSVAQLNTGQASTANSAVDGYWKFQYLPAYAGSDPINWGTFGNAYIVTNPTPSWTSTPAASAAAKWIGMDAYGSQPYTDGSYGGNIDALFQIQFNLDSTVSLASFQPSMTFSADNSVVDIFVNGKSQLARGAGTWGLPQAGSANQFGYVGFGYNRWFTIPAMASPDWQLGANTMTIYVKSGVYNMGFAAAISGTTACASNDAPTAVPAISGQPQVGQTLVGSYTYADTESDPEDSSGAGTSYQWVRSSTTGLTSAAQGTVVQSGSTLGVAGSVSYTAQNSDVGSYLFYCVTPVAVRGTLQGAEVCTAASGPITAVTPPQPATAKPVPTLAEMSLILLSSMIGILGIARVRRRHQP